MFLKIKETIRIRIAHHIRHTLIVRLLGLALEKHFRVTSLPAVGLHLLRHLVHVGQLGRRRCDHLQQHRSHQGAESADSPAFLVEGGSAVEALGIAAQPGDGARQLLVVDVPDGVDVLVAHRLVGGREEEVDEIEDGRGEASDLEVEQADLLRDGRLGKTE